MQYIEIGPVPGEENCAQVGSPDYTEVSSRECEVFRRMLYRLFPVPEGLPVAYVGRTHPHDFGNYREVSIRYETPTTKRSSSPTRSSALRRLRGTRSPGTNSPGTSASGHTTWRCESSACSPKRCRRNSAP